MTSSTDLPDDIDALKALLAAAEAQISAQNQTLADRDGIVQAPSKPRLIEGGMPTEATIASVIVSKYADHLPLYRQSQIYARQGVDLDRSTLAFWVGKAAHELKPVHDAFLAHLKRSTKLFMPSRQIAAQSPAW